MQEVGALIGSGMVADVYCYGEHAIKLYHPGRGKSDAFTEAAVLALLEGHELPVPRVHAAGLYGARWGLVMDRVTGETLGQRALADPAQVPAVLEEAVRLQLQLHDIAETRLRPLKARLATNIRRTPLLDEFAKARLVGVLADLPGGEKICHGDLHPFNIIGEIGRTTIIDWLDAAAGAPAADACRSYLLLRLGAPQIAEPYLELYTARSGLGREAILAWLPCVAAARLSEGVARDEAALIELATSG